MELNVYRPQVKLKQTIGIKKEEEDKVTVEDADFVQDHPFGGMLGSIICLMANLSYLNNHAVE